MPLFDLSLNYIQRDRVEAFDPLLYLMVCFVFFIPPFLPWELNQRGKTSFAILPLSGWVFFSERMQLGAKTKLWHKGQNVKTRKRLSCRIEFTFAGTILIYICLRFYWRHCRALDKESYLPMDTCCHSMIVKEACMANSRMT